jgi:hypothetical protein
MRPEESKEFEELPEFKKIGLPADRIRSNLPHLG